MHIVSTSPSIYSITIYQQYTSDRENNTKRDEARYDHRWVDPASNILLLPTVRKILSNRGFLPSSQNTMHPPASRMSMLLPPHFTLGGIGALRDCNGRASRDLKRMLCVSAPSVSKPANIIKKAEIRAGI